MVEQIINNNGEILAIIIRNTYSLSDSISFLTPGDFSQQLGYMSRSAGYVIAPHVHNLVPREVKLTQEVLYIKNGKVRVDFYLDMDNYYKSSLLFKGDVILLAFGGHGFEMVEDSEIIEIKQGPYCGEYDKVRFNPIDKSLIKY
jgi:hypothetical protein